MRVRQKPPQVQQQPRATIAVAPIFREDRGVGLWTSVSSGDLTLAEGGVFQLRVGDELWFYCEPGTVVDREEWNEFAASVRLSIPPGTSLRLLPPGVRPVAINRRAKD